MDMRIIIIILCIGFIIGMWTHAYLNRPKKKSKIR